MANNLRYTSVAVILHWMIAILIFVNLLLGWWMHEAIEDDAARSQAIAAFQWHKSLGLTVLGLLLARIVWRLTHRPPALVAPSWQKQAAATGHAALYLLMLILPLSGWLLVSTQWRGENPLVLPTLLYGRLEIPHLAGLHEAAPELRERLAGVFSEAHEILAWSLGLLALGHAAMALQHHFMSRDGLLLRMQPTPMSALALGSGLLVLVGLLFLTPHRAETSADIRSVDDGWPIDASISEIAYAGEHAGVRFRGTFSAWSVQFQPDESDFSRTVLDVRIDTASAGDGDPLHDETLREGEWLDVLKYPEARFRLQEVRLGDTGSHELTGTLMIKDHVQTIGGLELNATDDGYVISGKLTLDRGHFDIGMQSDPSGDWVSRRIDVEVKAHFLRPE